MPLTVLRISKSNAEDIEVIGEFADEDEAKAFAEDAAKCDRDSDYVIESPEETKDRPSAK